MNFFYRGISERTDGVQSALLVVSTGASRWSDCQVSRTLSARASATRQFRFLEIDFGIAV